MSLKEEDRRIIVEMEIEKAERIFAEQEALCKAGMWSTLANRLYYSLFHAVNALFINDGLEAVRHKTSHSLFSMHYVKTGILPIDYGHLYNNLQRLREKSDYNCFFDVSEQDIVDGISIAAEFIKAIEQLISERNK
jgi:uncharacterized protein (UPF0332 family)